MQVTTTKKAWLEGATAPGPETEDGPGLRAMIESLAYERERGLYLYEAFDQVAEHFTYAALHERVRACMAAYAAAGVAQGTRVLLPFETSIEFIVSFLALIGLGALTFSIKAVHDESDEEATRYAAEIVRRHGLTHVVRRQGFAGTGLQVLWPSAGPHEPVPFAPERPEELAFVQFSSGSTSFPKGIPVTRGALSRHLSLLNRHDGRRPEDVYVSWLPLYHDLGLILGLLTSLEARNDLHLASPTQFITDPLGWLRVLAQLRATHTATAYFAVSHCLNYLDRAEPEELAGLEFGALRCFLVGSDPTDFDRMMTFQSRLAPRGFRRSALQPAYGMAEAVLVVTSTATQDEPWAHPLPDGRRLVSTGRLLPGFELRLTRPDGTLCDEGELGQIELRGGTLAQGYFEAPDIEFCNDEGWFETGDLAYVVRDEVIIAGRMGDRIKVSGQSLFASDFEFAVESLPAIRIGSAAVFQIEYRIIVLARLTREAAGAAEATRAAVRAAIARRLGVKLPLADIHFVAAGQIRKTSSGKLRRRDIAQLFLEGKTRTIHPRREVEERLECVPEPNA